MNSIDKREVDEAISAAYGMIASQSFMQNL